MGHPPLKEKNFRKSGKVPNNLERSTLMVFMMGGTPSRIPNWGGKVSTSKATQNVLV